MAEEAGIKKGRAKGRGRVAAADEEDLEGGEEMAAPDADGGAALAEEGGTGAAAAKVGGGEGKEGDCWTENELVEYD